MKNKVEIFECPECETLQKAEIKDLNGFGSVTCPNCSKHVLLAPKNKERKKISKSNIPPDLIS